MNGNITNLMVPPDATILRVMKCIDDNHKGIALVVDEERRLVGTVTDGDTRRAVLTGIDLEIPVSSLLARKADSKYPRPVTVTVEASEDEILELMRRHRLHQIPVLDDEGVVVDLALLDDLLPDRELPLQAVIMAGGFGKRLRPLTEELPKPMLPVGDRPLMERTIERLRQAGIKRVQVSTHYMKEKITEYFGDGQDFGVDLNYVTEDEPLGTAGALSLLAEPDEPLLVINGDILTRLDFGAMLDFHRQHEADLTLAVRQYEFKVPYGVVETDGVNVVGISEKPCLQNFVNAGIYLLNPDVQRCIPPSCRYDMPELLTQMIAEGRRVICFPVREYWMDIGKYSDYAQALADVNNGAYADYHEIDA
jgi:dTDP-glucose pyrophosphorylase